MYLINRSIVTYGCENWSTINITPKRKGLPFYEIFKDWEFEKLNMKFCKYILGVSKMCTNIAVLSELGRYPLYINVLTHLFLFWHRLENSPTDLLRKAYSEMKITASKAPSNCKNLWLSNIIFYSEKLGIDLNICKNYGKLKFKNMLKKQFKINFLNVWEKNRDEYQENQGKLDTYFKFKRTFGYENYLDIKNPKKYLLTKYRLSNHCLRIETGRHERVFNVSGKSDPLPRQDRLCLYCNLDSVESEVHFLLECPLYDGLRKDILSQIEKYPNLLNLDKHDLFIWILSNDNSNFVSVLCNYIDHALKLRKTKS